jgi:hypothetical protein
VKTLMRRMEIEAPGGDNVFVEWLWRSVKYEGV